jgi:probable HAF family extracellular repeat protein
VQLVSIGRANVARLAASAGVGDAQTLAAQGNLLQHAVVWRAPGPPTPLPTAVPEKQGFARDLNSAGQIVGWASGPEIGNGLDHALLWAGGGAPVDLNQVFATTKATFLQPEVKLPKAKVKKAKKTRKGKGAGEPAPAPAPQAGVMVAYAHANAINERGQIAGMAAIFPHPDLRPIEHCVIWEAGEVRDVGFNLFGGDGCELSDIDGAGAVIGDGRDAQNRRVAFLWADGKATALGTLGGGESTAARMNGRRQVVGTAKGADGQDHAFLWQAGTMVDLGTGRAFGINARGQVVGTSEQAGKARAMLWDRGRAIDLNTLIPPPGEYGTGWVLEHAQAIDDQGRVAGVGRVTRVTSTEPGKTTVTTEMGVFLLSPQ